ncbi:hypothetical protein PAXRUDRAFT_830020 [Paxillus rubicundulus Ve08.2h10]|uniref:Uncharacterized protein n=1 Tax=Paxillus rubicundulus Ve08.2h10 TaxID=930991 RepID=A0A0D0DZB7_9AGAM|nr:hypothetical protein PAXRUDRAFT_830020 [Paxillus rubicundulus Ve08.2h10]
MPHFTVTKFTEDKSFSGDFLCGWHTTFLDLGGHAMNVKIRDGDQHVYLVSALLKCRYHGCNMWELQLRSCNPIYNSEKLRLRLAFFKIEGSTPTVCRRRRYQLCFNQSHDLHLGLVFAGPIRIPNANHKWLIWRDSPFVLGLLSLISVVHWTVLIFAQTSINA